MSSDVDSPASSPAAEVESDGKAQRITTVAGVVLSAYSIAQLVLARDVAISDVAQRVDALTHHHSEAA